MVVVAFGGGEMEIKEDGFVGAESVGCGFRLVGGGGGGWWRFS